MRKRYFISAAVACSLLLGCSGNALASEGLGLGVKAGTLGGGIEINASILENTRFRGGFNYLKYSFDSTISDINYDFEPEFNSISLLFDWHPFAGVFFLSGGAYINNNKIGVSGSVDQGQIPGEYADFAYLLDNISISGDVEFTPIAPYLGIGWRSNNGDSGWGFACDLGVMFQGAPDVTNLRINAPVNVNNIDDVKLFLAEQEEEIEDDLERFQYYPVASLSLIYNF